MLNNNSTAERHYQLWNETGLSNIKPNSIRYGEYPEGWNVVDEVRRIITPFIRNRILEIGCGYGRICRAFPPKEYIGVDINLNAIKKAKSLFPDYNFQHVQYVDQYPRAGMLFAYTVFLHIPENNIYQMLQHLNSEVEDIIIAEAMGELDQNFTQNYDHPDRFHPVYNRSTKDYEKIMRQHDFYLYEETIKPYYYFQNTKLHFLHFKRLPLPPTVVKLPEDLNNPHLEFERIYDDGWVAAEFSITLSHHKKNSSLFIEGVFPYLPENQTEINLEVTHQSNIILQAVIRAGEFRITSPDSLPSGKYQLRIATNSDVRLPDSDGRHIGFLLKKIGFI